MESPKVFISYAREDIETAKRIRDDLEKTGIITWLDKEDMLPGQNWKTIIGKKIRECSYFLALLSSNSLSTRGYVQKELKTALDTLSEFPDDDIFIIPVRLDDTVPIDEPLRNIHWADLFPSYEEGMSKILKVLKPNEHKEQYIDAKKASNISNAISISGDVDRNIIVAGNSNIVTMKYNTLIEDYKRFFSKVGFSKIELVEDFLFLDAEKGGLNGIISIKNEIPNENKLYDVINKYNQHRRKKFKLYLVYYDQRPSLGSIQNLREKIKSEVIPIQYSRIEQAANSSDPTFAVREFKEIEGPFLIRSDPYADFKPIHDPNWFYGRDKFMSRIPLDLAQGHHIGIFGLRRVGKTSLIKQIQQRFTTVPTAFIDFQSFSESKTEYILKKILTQLKDDTSINIESTEEFNDQILKMFELWNKRNSEPFLIVFDEIDKFFPNMNIKNKENISTEYIRLFRILRGLAQSYQCLVLLVAAYRPDVNRRNILSETIGENPMFQSFQEEYLGFLSPEDTKSMVQEIGMWKDINWEDDAAERVFYYCGGHPLVCRYFASMACKGGSLKHIDMERVEFVANDIVETFRKNDIGNYYKEAVWALLTEHEQEVLSEICNPSPQPSPLKERGSSEEHQDALINLERFGLVKTENDMSCLTANLFDSWLKGRLGI